MLLGIDRLQHINFNIFGVGCQEGFKNFNKSLSFLSERLWHLVQFVFQSEIIRNHRDKLAIGGLTSVILNGVAEIGIEGIDVASIPRDLDGMANGTLYAARGRLVFLCDRRVEHLCNAVDHIAVANGQQNRRAEILISLDVRRNADLMYYFGDLRFYIGSF